MKLVAQIQSDKFSDGKKRTLVKIADMSTSIVLCQIFSEDETVAELNAGQIYTLLVKLEIPGVDLSEWKKLYQLS